MPTKKLNDYINSIGKRITNDHRQMTNTMETKTRILIVDDNVDLCASLHEIVEENGYAAEYVNSGKEAIALSQKNRYDIALVDIKLPDISGDEVVREVIKISPLTEFIHITGHAKLDSAIEAVKQKHVVSYETKPLDLKHLLFIINQIVKRKKVEKMLIESEARYHDLYDNAPDMFVSVEAETANILRCNKTLAIELGYSKEEIVGQRIFFVYHPDCMDDVKKAFQSFVTTGEVHNAELQLKRKDGSKIDVILNVSSVRDGQGKILYSRSVWRDISERKQMEKQIVTSLREKETLIQEIYHRTRNNMQVICSLLKLQSAYTKDEKELTIFRKIDSRIKSMSLVHSKLYQSKDLSNINLKSYIDDLLHSLFSTYQMNPEKISFKFMADDILITFDTAIPFGLVINEIISNSLKHAFPDNREGEIRINLRLIADCGLQNADYEQSFELPKSEIRNPKSKMIELIIADNGIGMPKDSGPGNTNSLGFQLIFKLIEYQLQGKVDMDMENGVEYQIKFKEPDRAKRL